MYRALQFSKLLGPSVFFPLQITRQSPTAVLPTKSFVAPTLFQLPIAIPFAIRSRVSSILSDLWDSILRAVPKKKTSHRKKRQRFLAGKALKDTKELNTCSACGTVKRAHLLCPFCVSSKQQGRCTLQLMADQGQKYETNGRRKAWSRNNQ